MHEVFQLCPNTEQNFGIYPTSESYVELGINTLIEPPVTFPLLGEVGILHKLPYICCSLRGKEG